jgi:hypothetical protein
MSLDLSSLQKRIMGLEKKINEDNIKNKSKIREERNEKLKGIIK